MAKNMRIEQGISIKIPGGAKKKRGKGKTLPLQLFLGYGDR
jgi:hypothetical protein